MAWQFAFHGNDASRKWLYTGGLSALEGAFGALGWDDPHYVEECGCEHPGCPKWATSGMLTPDGYKHFCRDHGGVVAGGRLASRYSTVEHSSYRECSLPA
jgi:hypothetical protein